MQVVSKRLITGCGVLMALVLIAPGGLAQVDAVGEAGGQAVAQAESSYHADGSGAVDAGDEEQQNAREEAANHVRNSGDVYQDAYADASAESHADIDRPECESCRDTLSQVEQEGSGSFDTAHEAEQAADVDNEYVDAGADAKASGEAQAWYHELFNGLTDAFDQLDGLLDQDTSAQHEADAQVQESMDTENQLREEAASTLEQEQNLSTPVEPSTGGSLEGQHAAEAATSTVTEAGTP